MMPSSLSLLMPTRQLADVSVGAIGYGAMNLTWAPVQTPDEQAFAALKTAIDAGATFINTGDLYGQPERTLGLQLLARFFEAEPSYTSRVFLSVKGGIRPDWTPDSSEAYLRESVENINRLLKHKKMDLFEPARVDITRPIEETMRTLIKLRDEGHFKCIGLSEVSAATIRKAHAVAPITAVEAEYSLMSLDIEGNGVLATCKELGIPIIAYSPLARGLLTGTIGKPDDVPEGDLRRLFDRFTEEYMEKNLEFANKIKAVAERNGITLVQLCLAWLLAQWDRIIPIPGSTRVAGVEEGVAAVTVTLSPADLAEIRELVANHKILGLRYNAHLEHRLDV
ncbi:pyridoxine 4-dehydrogenase [Pseudohyphozyma bogoriensis]|nr:pyridoxine 4-dehydrogenase [Pseudohyphozyma bogoriensis]